MLSESTLARMKDRVSIFFMNDNSEANVFSEGPVLLFADRSETCEQYREIIEKAGKCISGLTDLKLAKDSCEKQTDASSVFIHIDKMDDNTKECLSEVEKICRSRALPMVLALDISLLDDVLSHLTYNNIEHILLDGEEVHSRDFSAELVASLPRRKQAPTQYLAEVEKETDEEIDLSDLQKISADVARISRALAELSGKSDIANPNYGSIESEPLPDTLKKARQSLLEQSNTFSTQTSLEIRPFDQYDLGHKNIHSISAQSVRKFIKARRLRDRYFKADLFADPAWDMLLDLMAAKLENKQVSVTSLCIAANVPLTTALRWVKSMTAQKIVLRRADTQDGRRVFIELSSEATAGMIGYFSMLKRTGITIE